MCIGRYPKIDGILEDKKKRNEKEGLKNQIKRGTRITKTIFTFFFFMRVCKKKKDIFENLNSDDNKINISFKPNYF